MNPKICPFALVQIGANSNKPSTSPNHERVQEKINAQTNGYEAETVNICSKKGV